MDIKSEFDKKGYVVVRQFLIGSELDDLQENTDRFIEERVPSLGIETAFYQDKNDKNTLKQIQHLEKHSEYFYTLGQSKKIVKLAENCLGGSVKLINMQYFNKVPGMNQETPAHQDGYFFKITPQEAVTMWLSLGDANGENGAVAYIPGSHRDGMRMHGSTGILGFSQGISDWSAIDKDAEIQMVASPGDILIHHSLTIHRANKNSTDRHRKSIGFIFYRDDTVIDKKSYHKYQENLKL